MPATDQMPDISKPRSSGVVIPHKATMSRRFAAMVIYLSLRLLSATVRYRLDDRPQFFDAVPKENIIFALWHNRLALSAILYHRFILSRAPDRRLAGLVSASRDGGLLAHILEKFRVEPVRGSSSRRGAQALVEMTTMAERGYDLAITPDGPRGPRYEVQEGVIATAQLTGLPIVPVSYHVNWKIQLKSWDRFQVPLPFARCDIVVGKIFHVPRELTDAEREELRKQVEAELRGISHD